MHLYQSNHSENLVKTLCHILAEPLQNPFDSEWIIVQNKTLGDWLSLQLAQHLGAWSGQDFPFPRNALIELLRLVLPKQVEALRSFEPVVLFFDLLQGLRDHRGEKAFLPLEPFYDPEIKLWDLASQTAQLFDRYALHRPEWVLAWDRADYSLLPKEALWQGILWNKISSKRDQAHWAALIKPFKASLRQNRENLLNRLPSRISLFGLNLLPPIYGELFTHLAQVIPVHFFHFSPSPHFYADLASKKQILKEEWKKGIPAEALHLEEGNALFAAWGKTAQEFQLLAEALWDYTQPEPSQYVPQFNDSWLQRLQSDIFHLTQEPLTKDKPQDSSLEFHNCPGEMREVELLKDRLLAHFNQGIQPEEVLVLAPNMSEYEPYIKDVFERQPNPLPYAFAEVQLKDENRAFHLLRKFFSLAQKRFRFSCVFELFEYPEVYTHFEVAFEELAQIQKELQAAEIRWGLDGKDKARWGLTQLEANSFQEGLTRLALGLVLNPLDPKPQFSTMPYFGLEGKAAEPLGGFFAYLAQLRRLYPQCLETHDLAGWISLIREFFQSVLLFSADFEADRLELESKFEELLGQAEQANFTSSFSLDCLLLFFEERLTGQTRVKGYLAKGITCASLQPMRSVPFRVIALLGLVEGAFPRVAYPSGIDLMSTQRRLGDRNLKDEDRLLFLETLLSARDSLILLYPG